MGKGHGRGGEGERRRGGREGEGRERGGGEGERRERGGGGSEWEKGMVGEGRRRGEVMRECCGELQDDVPSLSVSGGLHRS